MRLQQCVRFARYARSLSIKKRILLEDEASDWLQIWTAASLLDVKVIEMKFAFLANQLVFPNKVTDERKNMIDINGCYEILFLLS